MSAIFTQVNRMLAAAAVVVCLLLNNYLFAANKLSLRKVSEDLIVIDLSNIDPVAGFQFSINARGGSILGSYRSTERTSGPGWQVWQHLKDDSTLNVVILAPLRSALPPGQGVIGTVPFTLREIPMADTVRVFLSSAEICDANARILDLTTEELSWNAREANEDGPVLFTLEQNYPNPFNPSTTIAYRLERPALVQLVVYDIAGRQVKTLVNGGQSAGRYSIQWNADDDAGRRLSSGTYLARLQVEHQVAITKMILTK